MKVPLAEQFQAVGQGLEQAGQGETGHPSPGEPRTPTHPLGELALGPRNPGHKEANQQADQKQNLQGQSGKFSRRVSSVHRPRAPLRHK